MLKPELLALSEVNELEKKLTTIGARSGRHYVSVLNKRKSILKVLYKKMQKI